MPGNVRFDPLPHTFKELAIGDVFHFYRGGMWIGMPCAGPYRKISPRRYEPVGEFWVGQPAYRIGTIHAQIVKEA